MKKVLTIAGSDPSGGAGIQADIKTIAAHGMYAMSVLTALTAQNTTGVYATLDLPPDFVAKQLDCVFTDIRPDAVKIGMVSNARIIDAVADRLSLYRVENIVLDPVMVSTSGSRLLSADAQRGLAERLVPLCRVVTPNIPAAEALSGLSIHSRAGMLRAAQALHARFGTAVLVKGGHLPDCADDLLYENGAETWFCAERINNPNTHGTGCTLSSAVACGLAAGMELRDSVRAAKEYLAGALRAGLDLGRGAGPLNHMYGMNSDAQ